MEYKTKGINLAPKNKNRMRVIAHRTLVKFYTKRPDAKTAVENWYSKATSANWRSFVDVKNDFNSVDSVGNQHYVFNIKGNDKIRLGSRNCQKK